MLGGSTALSAYGLESVNDREALNDLTEDNMMAVQPWSDFESDEELGAVGVGTSIGHGEQVWLGEAQVEILIIKFGAVDALATFSVSGSDVTSLSHEARNNSVEGTALIVEWVAKCANTVGTVAECYEILDSQGNSLAEESENDLTLVNAINWDVEVDLVCDGGNRVSADKFG